MGKDEETEIAIESLSLDFKKNILRSLATSLFDVSRLGSDFIR